MQKNKDIHILAVKLLFYFLKSLFTFFLFYKKQIMIVDLQVLRCALPGRGRGGCWGGCSANAFQGMTRELEDLTRERTPRALSSPQLP